MSPYLSFYFHLGDTEDGAVAYKRKWKERKESGQSSKKQAPVFRAKDLYFNIDLSITRCSGVLLFDVGVVLELKS